MRRIYKTTTAMVTCLSLIAPQLAVAQDQQGQGADEQVILPPDQQAGAEAGQPQEPPEPAAEPAPEPAEQPQAEGEAPAEPQAAVDPQADRSGPRPVNG